MLYQAIPFAVIFILLILNIVRKRTWMCLSSFVYLYLTFCFGGAIFVHLSPRTGVPFCSPDAMCYLALTYGLLSLPLLFMNEHRKENGEVIRQEFNNIVLHAPFLKLLGILLLCSVLCFLPNIWRFINFLVLGVSRDEFRGMIDRSIRGNPVLMFASLMMLFAKLSMFLAILFYLFDKEKKYKKIMVLFFIGSCSLSLWAMQQIDRREVGKFLILIALLFISFYRFASKGSFLKTYRKPILFSLLLVIPFTIISVIRYDDWFYQIVQYFSIGPYFFNADYVAVTEFDFPHFYGDYCFTLLAPAYQTITDSHVVFPLEQIWGPGGSWFFHVYHLISNCHPFEFKTTIGCFLWDFPRPVVTGIIIFISLFFCLYFKLNKYSLRYHYAGFIYGYFLIFGTMMYPFSYFIFNLELVMIIVSWFVLKNITQQRNSGIIAAPVCHEDKLELKESE